MPKTHVLRRAGALAAAGACAAALGACGGDDGAGGAATAAAAADDRDAARVRLARCLRENGVDVPDRQGGGVEIRITPGNRDRLERAMQACEKEQRAAFADVDPARRQELEDRFAKFSSCLRKRGVEPPVVRVGGAPGDLPKDPPPRRRVDLDDPEVQAAFEACRGELPEGVPAPGRP